MRKLNCHHEEFLVKYMLVKNNYRIPPVEALPLPYGFKCHKHYKLELDLLKARMDNVPLGKSCCRCRPKANHWTFTASLRRLITA
jgi:hypothetical protein